MKRFLSVLLLTMMMLTLAVFAVDDYVGSPNDAPTTDEIVDIPAEEPDTGDSPQTGIVPVAAIAGLTALGLGAVGAVTFRKKNA